MSRRTPLQSVSHPGGTCRTTYSIVFNGDVVKSNTALSLEFKSALQTAVNVFEAQISENIKDWRPGSGKKVWDLVHPSLFPLTYGRTRILENREIASLTDLG